MFAIVQNNKNSTLFQRSNQRLRNGTAALLFDPNGAGNCLWNHPWIYERRQLHEPDAVRKMLCQIGADLQSQTGLPRSSGSKERDDAMTGKLALDLRYFRFAADEAGELDRQVVGIAVERFERGKIRRQSGTEHLVYRLRPVEIL